jgi:hypothetical protein
MTTLRGAFPPVVSAVGSIDPVIDHEPASVRLRVASEPGTAGRPLEEQQG